MGLLPPEASGTLVLTALFASIVYPSLFRLIARWLPPVPAVD